MCWQINMLYTIKSFKISIKPFEFIITVNQDCFLERLFIYAASCEWNKLSEHMRTSNFDCFRMSVKIMLFTQQYGC